MTDIVEDNFLVNKYFQNHLFVVYFVSIFALMNFEIPIKQNARKHNFEGMVVGEHRHIKVNSTGNAITCFKQYAKTRNLTWECQCYNKNGKIFVVRIK